MTPDGSGVAFQSTSSNLVAVDTNEQTNVFVASTTIAAAPTVTGVSPSTGSTAGGTPLTIDGTGFSGATAVDFGTIKIPASAFTVNADGTQITVASPAGTGTVDVTVTTPDGTSAKSSLDQFSYVASATAPTVTGISLSQGPTAGGTSLTITGTNLTAARWSRSARRPARSPATRRPRS